MSIVDAPPAIPKDSIDKDGTKVNVKTAKLGTDIQTQLGIVRKALILTVLINGKGDEYSHLFSLDKAQIAGSAGRVISKLKVKHVDELNDKILSKLVGMNFQVKNRGDKLYWY